MGWPIMWGWFIATPLDDVQEILRINGATLSSEDLQKAAIQGMLDFADAENGNSGSRLMTGEEKDAYQAWLMGQRSGYGLRIRIAAGRGLLIDSILSDSPADKAGLLEGDLIVAFADQPFTGLSPERVLTLLERPYDGKVSIDVLRGGELRRFQLERGYFWIQSATQSDLQIQVHFWGDGVSKTLMKLLEQSPQKIILDLRDNPGGLTEEVLKSIGFFTGPDVLVGQRHVGDKIEQLVTETEKMYTGQVIFLINKGTSGLSEWFVQALREHCSVQIVGEPSDGLVSEFRIYPISNNLFVNTAAAELRSGTGFSWKKNGIVPDIIVHTSMSNPSLGGRVVDLQLETARRLLVTD